MLHRRRAGVEAFDVCEATAARMALAIRFYGHVAALLRRRAVAMFHWIEHPMIIIGQRVAKRFLDPTSRPERKPLATAVG